MANISLFKADTNAVANQKASGRPFTVTEISTLVRNRLEEAFGTVEVEGEVTDFRGANAAGHLYFSLKDDRSRISAVLFAGRAAALRARVENGKKVRVAGKLTAYAGTSRYQIIVANLVDVGQGDLAARFEELKRRLEAEGLFAEARKRPLPALPRHIGVVTSPTGSVIRDFVNVLARRFPNVDILIAPARVQGEGAAEEIARGVRVLNRVGRPGSGMLEDLPPREVIVVMRGGGSMEELWCFNEEVVARAVYESTVPVVSGVGHQTDFTICDFAADVRAPTPSAAAELIVRPKADLARDVSRLAERMDALVEGADLSLRTRLAAVAKNRVFAEPAHALESYLQRVDGLANAMDAALGDALHDRRSRHAAAAAALAVGQARCLPEVRARLDALLARASHAVAAAAATRRAELGGRARQLDALSPLAVLGRGYSITLLDDGRALRDPAEAPEGTRLTTRLAGGEVRSTVGDGAPRARRPRRRAPPDGSPHLDLFGDEGPANF